MPFIADSGCRRSPVPSNAQGHWQIGRFICRSGEGIEPFEIEDFDFGYDERNQVFVFTDVLEGEEATATIYVFETEEPTEENDFPAADERLVDDLASHCTHWNTGRTYLMFREEEVKGLI